MSQRVTRTLILSALSLALLIVAGCGRGDLQEVAEASSWFHVRVPADWQTQVDPGSLLIYADDKLPESESEAFETLSILILTSPDASSTPVPEELTALVQARADSREWTDVTMGEPEATEIGGREGYRVDVSATDSQDRAFAGTVALVRTNGREALTVALSPAERWDKDASAIDDLFTEWYWHQSEGESAETSETP